MLLTLVVYRIKYLKYLGAETYQIFLTKGVLDGNQEES
jgi:hypothetical protein